jgi:hypothetical protein
MADLGIPPEFLHKSASWRDSAKYQFKKGITILGFIELFNMKESNLNSNFTQILRGK